MNYEEMEQAVKNYIKSLNNNNLVVAIRYDNVSFPAGTELEYSKSNKDREDERSFPVYGSKEYDNMETLGGTCCYQINSREDYRNYDAEYFFEEFGLSGSGIASKDSSLFNHCAIVVGTENTDCSQLLEDDGEILLMGCIVAVQLW